MKFISIILELSLTFIYISQLTGLFFCSLSGPCGTFCYLGHFKKLRIIIIIIIITTSAGLRSVSHKAAVLWNELRL